nr:ribonuclease H-like domain-containing protein [Tanacetum cinerariifolium]
GIFAQRLASGLFLSRSKFAEEILERAQMQNFNPCQSPVDIESKLGSDGDPTLYRSLAGALQYLTFTRPDLSYVVQQVCLYMHDPRDPHFTALKHILRYVRGTFDYGLQLHVSPTAQHPLQGIVCSLVIISCPGLPSARLHCLAPVLRHNIVVTLSHFSAEVEYRGIANVVAETAWIRNLLLELHAPLSTATLV